MSEATKTPITVRALNGAVGRTAVWVSCWLIFELLALTVAMGWFDWMSGALQNRYAPGTLLNDLGANFRIDHGASMSAASEYAAGLGAILAFIALLFGAFTGGGWLQIALERTEGRSLRRFFGGSARFFWRFLRLMFIQMLLLAALGWVVYETPWERFVLGGLMGVPDGDYVSLETLDSEATVRNLAWVQDGLYALLFALVSSWSLYSRTRLALHDTKSALWAGLCTIATIFRNPICTLRPLVLLFCVDLIVVYACGQALRSFGGDLSPETGLATLLIIFAIGRFAVAMRHLTRGARYYAAVHVSRELVRPIAKPDPWKESIGGPGGPRYPLGEDDEFAAMVRG
ncbi:MAG: hypothetical protein MK291_03075 [Planctomycetes bacterium]|nr:hypothetical protein [Planctomycetota bacterium]